MTDTDSDGFGEWDDLTVTDPADETANSGDDVSPLVFPNAGVWFEEYLSRLYRRQFGGGRTWCPCWWDHPEALARIDALWRAWEHMRLDPHTGVSVWFRDHADHHLSILMDADGPFRGCSPEKGHRQRGIEPLPHAPPPNGMFTSE